MRGYERSFQCEGMEARSEMNDWKKEGDPCMSHAFFYGMALKDVEVSSYRPVNREHDSRAIGLTLRRAGSRAVTNDGW